MSDTLLDLDATIARYATFAFDDTTPLLDAGLESLALLRLAVDVATDDDAEIDATRLADLKTVADLKGWLADLMPAAGTTEGDAR
ncbi:acyl carrier protein [Dactylosporangium roseum]|uniref:Acyl carrier protein n=1 Tax=Dactylosporangium roseum TaxID=47989 RepID=A0ABY5ZFV1_9ACTN|nr:acyl carrier protein [Dactylosporangium roseum]UWZ39573.1 acyl carrier protein [Dactylosporangium roseum]